ncbi:MAG TPA: hypothetical protein PKA79_00165 [Oligoflexia bacterium]|nr:hypothetical protein [Oligoflexia bacterium]
MGRACPLLADPQEFADHKSYFIFSKQLIVSESVTNVRLILQSEIERYTFEAPLKYQIAPADNQQNLGVMDESNKYLLTFAAILPTTPLHQGYLEVYTSNNKKLYFALGWINPAASDLFGGSYGKLVEAVKIKKDSLATIRDRLDLAYSNLQKVKNEAESIADLDNLIILLERVKKERETLDNIKEAKARLTTFISPQSEKLITKNLAAREIEITKAIGLLSKISPQLSKRSAQPLVKQESQQTAVGAVNSRESFLSSGKKNSVVRQNSQSNSAASFWEID